MIAPSAVLSPALFFHYLHHIKFSFYQGKIQRPFQTFYHLNSSFFFFNFLGVTLLNLKLYVYFGLKQEIVTTPFRRRYGPGFDLVSDRN